jgi:hypothetical protein
MQMQHEHRNNMLSEWRQDDRKFLVARGNEGLSSLKHAAHLKLLCTIVFISPESGGSLSEKNRRLTEREKCVKNKTKTLYQNDKGQH